LVQLDPFLNVFRLAKFNNLDGFILQLLWAGDLGL